jgi:drug/metabolite transporter (DMT)-like permease
MNASAPAPTTPAPGTAAPPAAAAKFGAIDLALLMMTVIWGINAVVVKATYAQIPPMAFMAIRFLVAGALLLIVAWGVERSLAVHRRDWALLVAAAMVGTGFYQPLFLTGLSMTTASNTSLIIAASPAFVALLNRLLGRELLAPRGWLGIALAFVGIVLIVEGGGGLEFGSQVFIGDLLILVGTFLWASYAVLAAPLMLTYSPLRVTALTTGIGALPLILLGMPAVAALPLNQVQPSGWAGLLYSAIFAIVVAYIIWNSGVKKIGGARTSLYSNLIPVIGTITAAIVLGEAITPLKVVGAAVIFVGLHLARTAKVVRNQTTP